MTLEDFADTMNRIIPKEPNSSLEISVEIIRELYQAAGRRPVVEDSPLGSKHRRIGPEEEFRRLLHDRGLVLRGPFDPRARRLTLVRSKGTPGSR